MPGVCNGGAVKDPIPVDVRMLAFDRPVTPGLDVTVDLLAQFADPTGGYPPAPIGPR